MLTITFEQKNEIPRHNMPENKVKLATIAKLAGVSVMTVSRVLSQKNNYKDATRDKIEKIAEELGYFPNILGRSLLRDKLNTVGIIIPNIIHSFFPHVVNSIEEELAKKGYNTFLCCSHDDTEIEAQKAKILLGHRVAGVIMIPSLRTKTSEKTAAMILKNGCPLVVVDRLVDSVKTDTVCWKSAEAMNDIVEHLASRGCRNFVYCSGVKSEWKSRSRTSGFFNAIKRLNLKCAAEINCNPDDEAAETAMRKLAASKVEFDAVCCATDIHASSVLLALKKLGKRVPQDVALTGFGGIMNSHNSKLTLTTVVQDATLMGRVAAEVVIKRMEERDAGGETSPFVSLRLPVKIEYGESSLH